MGWDAYVFGDLSWPMPDPGLVAVWRAMSFDASRWTDWDGFVDGSPDGTVAEFVDRVGTATRSDAPFELHMSEKGVRLRAFLEHADADLWQRLAVAWRLAADIGATGEFAWVPGDATAGIAYRGVIADWTSRWEKLTGADASAIEALPGRREIDALVMKHEATVSILRGADVGREPEPAEPRPEPDPASPLAIDPEESWSVPISVPLEPSSAPVAITTESSSPTPVAIVAEQSSRAHRAAGTKPAKKAAAKPAAKKPVARARTGGGRKR